MNRYKVEMLARKIRGEGGTSPPFSRAVDILDETITRAELGLSEKAAIRDKTFLEATRLLCHGCRRPNDSAFRPPHRTTVGINDWWHENAIQCDAGLIFDHLEKTRRGEV